MLSVWSQCIIICTNLVQPLLFLSWHGANRDRFVPQGSRRTLELQGGPTTEEEARIFETDSLFEENLQMRKWDEGAKVEVLVVVPPCDVETVSTVGALAYKRQGNMILAQAFQASL